MLSLNIKSSNYMCIDIATDSVIHEHIIKKLNATWRTWDAVWHESPDMCEDEGCYSPLFGSSDPEDDGSYLMQLDSFHISLGKPPPNSKKSIETVKLKRHEFHELIGVITLADIHVSKKKNKKSAWISINDTKFSLATRIPQLSYMHTKHLHLHISLANLTGWPVSSIGRPEDCIIKTITDKDW